MKKSILMLFVCILFSTSLLWMSGFLIGHSVGAKNIVSYLGEFPVSELPISDRPPTILMDYPKGKNIDLRIPSDCAPDRIISVSNGRSGLVVGYRSSTDGRVKAALYPNPQDSSGPEFTFTFEEGK